MSPNVRPLRDGPGTEHGFVALMRDVTRERRMEARFRRGERLEALGTLAGGVAHDFNNIVGSSPNSHRRGAYCWWTTNRCSCA